MLVLREVVISSVLVDITALPVLLSNTEDDEDGDGDEDEDGNKGGEDDLDLDVDFDVDGVASKRAANVASLALR